MLSLEQLPAKEKKKRLEDFEAKEKEELQALIEKRKKSATKKKNKEKETKKDEYSGKKILSALSQTAFQSDTLESLCDWLVFLQSLFHWLRMPSSTH